LSATHDTSPFPRASTHSGPPADRRAGFGSGKILRWHDDLDRGAEQLARRANPCLSFFAASADPTAGRGIGRLPMTTRRSRLSGALRVRARDRMNGVDLARFDFDYDTTWHAFFLDADLNVYSRYGGRDEDSSDGRLSTESLATTIREVLAVHERTQRSASRFHFTPRRRGNSKAGDGDIDFHPSTGQANHSRRHPPAQVESPGVRALPSGAEYRLLQAFHDKTFFARRSVRLSAYGEHRLRFDRRHGHKIENVTPDSPAARAGLLAATW